MLLLIKKFPGGIVLFLSAFLSQLLNFSVPLKAHKEASSSQEVMKSMLLKGHILSKDAVT